MEPRLDLHQSRNSNLQGKPDHLRGDLRISANKFVCGNIAVIFTLKQQLLICVLLSVKLVRAKPSESGHRDIGTPQFETKRMSTRIDA